MMLPIASGAFAMISFEQTTEKPSFKRMVPKTATKIPEIVRDILLNCLAGKDLSKKCFDGSCERDFQISADADNVIFLLDLGRR